MTISHGQIEVERGFDNSSLVLKDNLKIDSIIARRFIYSYMSQKEIQPHKILITPQLMKSVSTARDRYVVILKNGRKTKYKKKLIPKSKK